MKKGFVIPTKEVLKLRMKMKIKSIKMSMKLHLHLIFKQKNYKHIYNVVTQKCPYCNCHKKVYTQHQNCSYVEELSNYYWACKDCHDYMWQMYQDQWDEYYAGCL